MEKGAEVVAEETDTGTWKDGEAYRLESVWDCFKYYVCKKDGTSNINMIRKQVVSFFAFGSVNLGGKHIV